MKETKYIIYHEKELTETLTIHFIMQKEECMWYIGENIDGKVDSTVYIKNPAYDKPVLVKKQKGKFIFHDKNAFIKTSIWVS